MTTSYERYEVKADGITLSRIVWQRFHRPMPGTVEAMLMANPELSRSGPYLARGTVVYVPVVSGPAAREVDAISLWS